LDGIGIERCIAFKSPFQGNIAHIGYLGRIVTISIGFDFLPMINIKTHLNTLGVVLATVGSYLVWRYLTELNFADKESYLQGKGTMTIPVPTEQDIAKFKRSVCLSKLGLGLIFAGGLAQIVSNHLPDQA
jgi:hypothetical protein